jgi:uncharacterized protein YjiS (DUF1127 family)
MNPRRTQEQIGLFPIATSSPAAEQAEAHRLAAARGRETEGGLRRVLAGIGTVLAAIASWPERMRTYESLRRLSDRELADIGLSRGEIAMVFEPGFRAGHQPAAAPIRPTPRASGAPVARAA